MTKKLSMLEGLEAPEWLAGDLAALGELPESAQADLWRAVEVSIVDPMPPTADAVLGTFCKENQVDPDVLTRALKAARYMYRAAAQTGSPKAKLIEDTRALLGDRAAVPETILSRHFTPAIARLEGEINTKTLVGHGKVLTDFEWRIATVSASTHGRNLKLPIVTLTLKYEEAGARRTITLNALPTVLKRLRDMLGGLLG